MSSVVEFVLLWYFSRSDYIGQFLRKEAISLGRMVSLKEGTILISADMKKHYKTEIFPE
jgi:hypothetical protein